MKYSPGDVILTSEPYVYTVYRSCKGKICSRCLKKWDRLRRCPGCLFMYYCSDECERADRQGIHKHECPILRLQPRKGLSTLVCNLIRMCISYQYSRDTYEKTWMMYDGTQRVIEKLISCSDVHTLDETVLSDLITNLNSTGIVVDRDTLIYRFGQLIGNEILISDDTRLFQREKPAIGSGLYVEATAFDHSCRPNAICVFDGPILTIRALTEIDTDKEKITISYVGKAVALPRNRRRAEIQSVAHFDCLCDICTDENSDAPRVELMDLLCGMRFEIEKDNPKEVQQISAKVFPLIQSIFGQYSRLYIEYMLYHVQFKCKQIRKTGMQGVVDSRITWTEFELCLRKVYGTKHPFYEACLQYREILMPSSSPQR